MGAFEMVFHYDWDYTKVLIGNEDPSFLKPGLTIDGESEDWGARGALLEKYRRLIETMNQAGLDPLPPFASFMPLHKGDLRSA